MGRRKLRKFKETAERFHIVQPGHEKFDNIKGDWNEVMFKNQNPIVLELACGRAEYTTGLATEFLNKNYIGVDIKGERLWHGSNVAAENNLDNVAFLRTPIHQISNFFGSDEVDELWIIHPDPRPRKRDSKRRLTHPNFLKLYQQIAKPGATVHLRTDNAPLYHWTLGVLEVLGWKVTGWTTNLYESEYEQEHFGIKTRYERIFVEQGETIHYLRFVLPS
jgi:tRNA (guanine-N7-)-methyltransferase